MTTTSAKPKKKTHGIYYTPDSIASLLCDWAIQSTSDTVLEPSFGGCGFLRAVHNRFLDLGVVENEIFQRIYGSDIDSTAFQHLQKILPFSNGHFLESDFLALHCNSFPLKNKFSVIAGNPPYVSHHNMLPDQKEKAWEWLKASTFNKQIDKRSSLWVYFILHSLSFLQEGGRIVWVLPGSFLHADYASEVRNILSQHFSRILAIVVGPRLFISDGTEEISIFLLGDDYHNSSLLKSNVYFSFVSSPQEVPEIIQTWEDGKLKTQEMSTINFLPKVTADIYHELSSSKNVITIGDLYDVQIGVVSGANDFFILTKTSWETHQLPEDVLTYVLTRFRDTRGLSMRREDLLSILEAGKPCMLLDTNKVETLPKSVEAYLSKFPKENFERTTFQRRAARVWHHFNDHRIPDAFFPYMNNDGPYIVINESGMTSTNSVHRMFLKGKITEAKTTIRNLYQKQVAISILSTYSQLSAELEGRTYGAGVLKHEPSETKRIKLFFNENLTTNEIQTTFEEIDQAIRKREYEKAQDKADNFVLSHFSIMNQDEYRKEFQRGLSIMRLNRSPSSWKGQNIDEANN